MQRPRFCCGDYTVGWVSALPIELAAAQEMLDEEHGDPHYKTPPEDTLYTFGRIGEHNVVITCLPAGEIGNSMAAVIATRMKATFTSIKFGLLVGVGGGIPRYEANIRLGDVVISQPNGDHGGVVQYDYGKAVPGGFLRTGHLNKPPTILLQAISKMKANHIRGRSALADFLLPLISQPMFSRGDSDSDILFEWDYEHVLGDSCSCQMCDRQRLVKRTPRQNEDVVIHHGTIASGNCVIRDGRTRKKLADALGNIICFDMEAAGLMNCFPCLVIRGICDYADSHKNKKWQPYAAATAAASAKELLSVIPAAKVTEMPSADDTTAKLELLRSAIEEIKLDEFTRMLLVADSAMEKAADGLPKDSPECLWVFQNIDFQEWYSSQPSQVLWLSASSPLTLYHVASHISMDCRSRHFLTDSPGVVIFCSSGMDRTLTGIEVFHTIFFQLLLSLSGDRKMAITQKFLRALFQGIVRDRRATNMELSLTEKDISKRIGLILDAPILNLAAALETVLSDEVHDVWLILDGIDKVDEGLGEFSRNVRIFVDNLCRRVPSIHVLLTSQAHTIVSEALSGLPSIERDKERKECLESLRFDNTRFGKISKQHKCSFEWIWTHDEYKAWATPHSSQLLYVQGKPGSGKSTLAKYFYNSLAIKLPAADHAVVAKFFYSFREGERQTSHFNMLLTILYDILSQDEVFFYHHFQSRYRHHKVALLRSHGQEAKHATWDYESLKEQLSFLEDYRSTRPIYLFIDAVDESDREDRRDILNLLYEIGTNTKYCTLKIFVASRPVENEPSRGDSHHHIVLQNETRSDIANFAGGFLKGLQSTRFMIPAIDYIVQNAQGVFLWVELVGAELVALAEGGYAARDIFVFLKELPKELEALYVMMLQRIKRDRSNLRDGLKIFHFALFAARPLKENEFLHALGIPIEPNIEFDTSEISFQDCLPTNLTRRLIACAGNFLEIRPPVQDTAFSATVNMPKEFGTVQVIHQTVWANSVLHASPFTKTTVMAQNRMLHAACRRGFQLAVEILLLLRAEVNAKDEKGLTPIWNAAEHGHAAVVVILMAKAAFNGHEAVVRCLADVVPHSPDLRQETPLSYAAANGHDNVVRALIEGTRNNSTPYRADLTATNDVKQTPLSQAAEHGHQRVALALLGWGANLESKDIYDMTPLFRAAHNGHEALVRLLIEQGASIHCKDTYGGSPLSWAAQNGHEGVVKLLMEKGVASDDRDVDGRTPLSRAAGKGHVAVVTLLLRNGAVADSLDVFNRSPLSWASCNGHTAIARLLLQAGVKIDSQAGNGRTPLSWAAGKGQMGVVELLIDSNADIDYQDDDGLSPLAWAARYGCYIEVMNLLRQRGTRSNDSKLGYSQTQSLLIANISHQGTIQFPAMENPDQPLSQQPGDRSYTAASTTGGNTYIHGLAIDSLNRSSPSHKLSSIQLIHSPIQSSPSTTSSVTVESDISKRGISAGGRRPDTPRPMGVAQELLSDQETTDSDNTTIPNANNTSFREKRRYSLSRGYSPAAKRRRVEGWGDASIFDPGSQT
ncbi:unnamed protein product [Penicillium pancosmium]